MMCRRPVLAVAVLALSIPALLSGCSTPTPVVKKASLTVTGTLDVPNVFRGATQENVGESCDSREGYGDIRQGAQLVVKDASGTTIGVSTLGAGQTHMKDLGTLQTPRCWYPFSVSGLPSEKFYSIHVGNASRGDVQFTKDELRQGPKITVG